MEELIMERHIYGLGTNYLYVLLYRKNEVNPVVKIEFSPSQIERYVNEEEGLISTNIDRLNYYSQNAHSIKPGMTFNQLANRTEHQHMFIDVVENWVRSQITNFRYVKLYEEKKTEIHQLEEEYHECLKREQAARYEIEELKNKLCALEREAGRPFQEFVAGSNGQRLKVG